MSVLWRVNKGSKERQAHTLGVHSKKGVHLIEVSVKRELTVLLLTSILETYMHSVEQGVTALTGAVSGEKQIYSGNLEILPGIGKPGKFFGKYEIFSGN